MFGGSGPVRSRDKDLPSPSHADAQLDRPQLLQRMAELGFGGAPDEYPVGLPPAGDLPVPVHVETVRKSLHLGREAVEPDRGCENDGVRAGDVRDHRREGVVDGTSGVPAPPAAAAEHDPRGGYRYGGDLPSLFGEPALDVPADGGGMAVRMSGTVYHQAPHRCSIP